MLGVRRGRHRRRRCAAACCCCRAARGLRSMRPPASADDGDEEAPAKPAAKRRKGKAAAAEEAGGPLRLPLQLKSLTGAGAVSSLSLLVCPAVVSQACVPCLCSPPPGTTATRLRPRLPQHLQWRRWERWSGCTRRSITRRPSTQWATAQSAPPVRALLAAAGPRHALQPPGAGCCRGQGAPASTPGVATPTPPAAACLPGCCRDGRARGGASPARGAARARRLRPAVQVRPPVCSAGWAGAQHSPGWTTARGDACVTCLPARQHAALPPSNPAPGLRRVTPEGGQPVQAATATAAWKALYATDAAGQARSLGVNGEGVGLTSWMPLLACL